MPWTAFLILALTAVLFVPGLNQTFAVVVVFCSLALLGPIALCLPPLARHVASTFQISAELADRLCLTAFGAALLALWVLLTVRAARRLRLVRQDAMSRSHALNGLILIVGLPAVGLGAWFVFTTIQWPS